MHTHSSASRGDIDTATIQGWDKSPPRIMVVDDDRDLCQLCVDVLSSSGYQVDTAEDGEAGWQALEFHSYNLLITDNKMPKVSGIELVMQLRSAGMDLPVVLASSLIPTDEIGRNPSLRLAATLLKPFSIEELLSTVAKVLREVGSGPLQTSFLTGATA